MEWTDDMRVFVAPGRELVEVVELIERHGDGPWRPLFAALTDELGLSWEAARLAIDRVDGGRVRAGDPANEPDAAKDPIAYLSYHRGTRSVTGRRKLASSAWTRLLAAIGTDAAQAVHEALASAELGAPQREAVELWSAAWMHTEETTRAPASTDAALELVALASVGPRDDAIAFERVLMQTANALARRLEATRAALGERRYADYPSAEWFDAIRLAEASRRLATLFAANEDPEHELAALRLRCGVVCSLLQHCVERVGAAVVDYSCASQALGDSDDAEEGLRSFVADAQLCLGDVLADGDAYHEEVLALEQLVRAIDALGDPTLQALRARAAALIAGCELA
ncbi:MAG TPA: hypothetical protein VG755_20125 [Nannocystaceae bacterium]|nr:hypothetical protein [Nannocystaceae bacterium]